MDKLKKVFSPGSKKDDEVMYGDTETRRKESLTNTTGQEPPKLYPTEGAAGQKESGGVLSQITNPGGNKYDETRYGTTATSNPNPEKLHTDPSAPKDHTVMNQILNPGGHKYDEQRFGETATTARTEHGSGQRGIGEKLYPDRAEGENPAHYPGLGNTGAAGTVDPNAKLETEPNQKDHTVLRQILNPSGNKRDDVAFGTTAHSAGDKGLSDTDRSDHLSRDVGVVGTTSTLTDRTVASDITTGNRETSVAGTTAGAGAPIVVGSAANTTPQYNEPQSHVLDRSHPLRDGSGAAPVHINPVGAPEASMSQHAAQTESIGHNPSSNTTFGDNSRIAGSHINPVGAPSTANATLPAVAGAATAGGLAGSSQTRDQSTLGGMSGSSTLGSSALGTSSGASHMGTTTGGATYTDHAGTVHTSSLHPVGTKLDCDGNPVPGYVHHVAGPHSLDIANILDPRVAATPASPVTLSSEASHSRSTSGAHAGTGLATGAGVGTGAGLATGTSSSHYPDSSLDKDRSTSHGSNDHEKKEKTGLLQKILHPKGHKEEKEREASHGSGHPSTTVDDRGHNVLHKDPPAH